MQMNQADECQGVTQIFLATSPILNSFHPISLNWKRIPGSLPNRDLLNFKLLGSKPGVRAG